MCVAIHFSFYFISYDDVEEGERNAEKDLKMWWLQLCNRTSHFLKGDKYKIKWYCNGYLLITLFPPLNRQQDWVSGSGNGYTMYTTENGQHITSFQLWFPFYLLKCVEESTLSRQQCREKLKRESDTLKNNFYIFAWLWAQPNSNIISDKCLYTYLLVLYVGLGEWVKEEAQEKEERRGKEIINMKGKRKGNSEAEKESHAVLHTHTHAHMHISRE